MKSPDRESVRVSTPPRSIVLSHHHFPSASDEPERSSPTDTLNAEEEFDEDPDHLVGVAQAVALVHQKDNQTKSRNHFRTIDRYHR